MREIRGLLYTPDFEFKPGVIFIREHTIENIEYVDKSELSTLEQKQLVIPGLIDIHMHGCNGVDICNASQNELQSVADYEKENGITSFCAATMTLPLSDLKRIACTIRRAEIPAIKGIYLEGPFISEKYKGAQNSNYILKADIEIVRELNEISGGMIKKVTVAPEVEGTLEMLKEGHGEVSFSIAHSDADYDTACFYMEKGIRHVTHLYNAMAPYNHRMPGIVGAVIDNKNVMAEIISDGVHIHPSVVRNAFNNIGTNRIILISDSMEATGLPDGEYTLAEQKVVVIGSEARLSDGTLAGSVTNLYKCMKQAISFGVKPEDAIRAATYNPAKAIGMDDKIGSLMTGMDADIIILDEDYNIISVIC